MFYNSVSGFLRDVTRKQIAIGDVDFIIGGTRHKSLEAAEEFYMYGHTFFSIDSEADRMVNDFAWSALIELPTKVIYQPKLLTSEEFPEGLMVPNWFRQNGWESIQEFVDTLEDDKNRGIDVYRNDVRIYLKQHGCCIDALKDCLLK